MLSGRQTQLVCWLLTVFLKSKSSQKSKNFTQTLLIHLLGRQNVCISPLMSETKGQNPLTRAHSDTRLCEAPWVLLRAPSEAPRAHLSQQKSSNASARAARLGRFRASAPPKRESAPLTATGGPGCPSLPALHPPHRSALRSSLQMLGSLP